MCGISGYIEPQSSSFDESTLRKMLRRISHRGPDGEGVFTEETMHWRVALGHRRLSIIDLSTGNQPMGLLDSSEKITFNGEIYNYKELKSQLIQRGRRFQTQSDTEVLLQYISKFGDVGLRDLNGMFAFAVWNPQSETLLLARDRAGIKPLYYSILENGGIVFSSELTSLLQHPSINKQLSWDAMAHYFFHDYVPCPYAMIQNVFKLPPGGYLKWTKGRIEGPKLFWKLRLDEPPIAASEESLTEQLEKLLSASVERQMISDVPLGSFLSGGIDSSLISAIATRHSKEKLHTFSIGFQNPSFDESGYAQLVSEHLGTVHHLRKVSDNELYNSADQILATLDEPLADPSLIPTSILSSFAKKEVKVVLSGDGGDELWAGYPTYLAAKLGDVYRYTPKQIKKVLQQCISNLPVRDSYQSVEWKLKRFVQRFDNDPLLRHFRWMSNTDLPELQNLIGTHPFNPNFPDFNLGKDQINNLLGLDFYTYLSGVLTKVDRASMGNGLEVRPPLLDNELIEFAFSVSSKYKLRGTRGKYLLKEVAKNLLPQSILERKKKGFAIPLASLLRNQMKEKMKNCLADSPLWTGANAIRMRNVFSVWNKEHQEKKSDRSKPLWALYILDSWMKREHISLGKSAPLSVIFPINDSSMVGKTQQNSIR